MTTEQTKRVETRAAPLNSLHKIGRTSTKIKANNQEFAPVSNAWVQHKLTME
jgi:hypothetical protein